MDLGTTVLNFESQPFMANELTPNCLSWYYLRDYDLYRTNENSEQLKYGYVKVYKIANIE